MSASRILSRVVAGLALASAAAAHGAPASAASVEQLLLLTKAPSLIDSMLADSEATFRRMAAQAPAAPTLSAEQRAALDRLPARLSALMREEMTWERLKPGFVQMYSETFEQEEIDALIAFYRTPIGQAYVDKLPVVMRRSMDSMQQTLQRLSPKINAIVQETMREAGVAK